MYGVRICPDLDTCMYTLGGGIDPERGWGHRNETWHAKEELAAYGVQPDWFGLGDRDLATHLVRSQMLRAGYPLSEVTEALCKRWSPGATLLPATDDRSETHVVITDPDNRANEGRSTFRSGGCGTGRRCRRTASLSSAPTRPPRAPESPTRSRRPTWCCLRRPTRWSASAPSWPYPASAAHCGRPRRA